MFRYRFFVQMLLSHAEPVKIPPTKNVATRHVARVFPPVFGHGGDGTGQGGG